MASAANDASLPDKGFFGHPKALAYLAFTEAWERFSYYGMTALVVLYMTQQLLLPGHAENVVGLASLKAALEDVFGPLSTQAFASQVYGLYTGFVYFTPIVGGWIADRWLGARRTVVAGAVLMSAGHFAMAFDASFLAAMLLLILGTGCLKGNISAQVGHLYSADDETMRTRGYTIFSMAINMGAATGPLVCGLLAQLYGWHTGFAAAGILMLAALITYLVGQKHLPPDSQARRRRAAVVMPLSTQERSTVLLLIATMAITIFQSVSYYQFYNVGIVWVNSHVDLTTPLGSVPAAWFISIDSLVAVLAAPGLIAFWSWQASRSAEPGDLTKIGYGAAIAAAAALLLSLAAMLAGNGKVSIWLPLLAFSLQGIAFLYYWPTLLTLVSQAAPAKVNATLMGTVFLTLFVTGLVVGWIGTFYEPLGPAAFWLVQALISAAGMVLVLAGGRWLSRALEPQVT